MFLLFTACFLGFMNLANAEGVALRPVIGGDQLIASDVITHITAGLVSVHEGSEFLCTTSIVANDLVITAKHCVKEVNTHHTLVFGRDLHASTNPTRDVDQVIIPNDQTDVALLHFPGGLPEGYVPAKLLPFDQQFTVGDPVVVAGYGIWNAERNDGEGFLRKTELSVLTPNYSETEIELDQSRGRGACHGDSGGPAYVVINKKPYLFGVTSRGTEDCATSVIYTKIAPLQAWFEEAALRARAH